MTQGKQLRFAALTAFLLIVIEQSAAKCVQSTFTPGNFSIDKFFFTISVYGMECDCFRNSVSPTRNNQNDKRGPLPLIFGTPEQFSTPPASAPSNRYGFNNHPKAIKPRLSYKLTAQQLEAFMMRTTGSALAKQLLKLQPTIKTAQKSCTQLSGYNGHLAYWRDGAALQLVNKNLITVNGQYFIGEVLVNNQWTNQDAKGINGALFNMNYMCSVAICASSQINCLSSGTFGALSTGGRDDSPCMGKFNKQGNDGHGMYYICEYENM